MLVDGFFSVSALDLPPRRDISGVARHKKRERNWFSEPLALDADLTFMLH